MAAIVKSPRHYHLEAHLSARAKSFAALKRAGGPDIVFVVSSDRYIRTVSRRVLAACGPNTKVLVHCAGSMPSTVLANRDGLSRLMLHPIQSVPSIKPVSFTGVTFGYETLDRDAARFAFSFVRNIGGKLAMSLQAEQLPLYHATNVIAANFITLLGSAVESLAPKLSLRRTDLKAALSPLMLTALQNVLQHDAEKVLTGPIARGDSETIENHRKALRNAGLRDILRLYDAFVALAREL